LDTDRPIGISETDYIKIGLKKIRTFARNNKINTWIVTHPQKLLRDKDGKYPIPTLYDISGSAHWYNKADNGFTVYQNEQGETEIHVTKMKVSYYGQKGKVSLKYVKGWQGYEDLNDYQERQLWNQ
jgi:twinkle protein